jgi:hypothetical protein
MKPGGRVLSPEQTPPPSAGILVGGGGDSLKYGIENSYIYTLRLNVVGASEEYNFILRNRLEGILNRVSYMSRGSNISSTEVIV